MTPCAFVWPCRYVVVGVIAAMWKWYYYAPNTYKQLKVQQMRKEGITVSTEEAHQPFTLPVALLDFKTAKRFNTGPIDFIRRVMGPYLALRFFAMPLPLLAINPAFYWAAVTNIALAYAPSRSNPACAHCLPGIAQSGL